jgi:hypothetical protein
MSKGNSVSGRVRLLTCYGVLAVNVVFWLVIVVYSAVVHVADRDIVLVVMVLLALKPLAFLVFLFGVWKRLRVLYLLSLPFVLLNALLSVTDQVGGYDGGSFALNVLALAALLVVWSQITRRPDTARAHDGD